MTIDGVGGARDREWRTALCTWRPPHKADDWASPAMWRLLQLAVDEPVLRAFFPWTSMNELHVSATGDFRDYRNESFPAVAASASGFVVMTHPWGLEHVALETSDPALALACLVHLIQDRCPTPDISR
ncbi:DUF6193 family natural product biosynthesis protein [Streptomyces sp. NPDC004393]|uniref:DUF6193 family natural product biosynthesis protein n=1 Tax=Streptomyces sp. NPDC004533 TaxID=3154278 RepID=UPI0033B02C56